FWQRGGLVAGALLGLALAFALLVKFTAMLLLPALVLMAAVAPWRPGPPPPARALLLGAAAAAGAGLLALCAGYLFHGVGAPLSAFAWRTPVLARLAQAAPGLRLPLPLDFLTGIDVSFSAERTKEWPVAILGQPRRGRLAYYFVLLWAVKTALAAAAAQVAGAAWLWRSRALRAQPALRALAGVSLALLAYLSFFFKAKLGYRHALMLVPLACILCAAGLASRARGRRAAAVAALVAALAMAEQVPYLGNHLAFSNALVWPKREAYRVMADSNLDWGQNDDKVLAWMAASARPLTRLNPPHLAPGENVVSASVFVFGNHGWARRHLRPRSHFRHTYLLFDVTEADFARMLEEERRLVPSAAEGCATAVLAPLPPAQPLALAGTARLRLLCLRAASGADLAVTAAAGRALVGPWGRPMREWDPLGPGQAAWFRLPPG
ncbi:MAG TPA: hypothetical protein VFO85_16115, partial [Vicinamibacteria bacterium]|nr:hypothetical protein [Vicinamibacteria bacterium]